MTDQLTEQQIQKYHTDLIGKKNSINKEIEVMDVALRNVKTTSPDPIDSAAAVEERNTIMAQMDQKRTALKEVDNALNNFDEFGYCLSCGEEINIKRIEFNLATTKCIDCATKEERHQRISRG